MEMTRQERLERLLNAYSHHYDIDRDVTVEGGSFPATAFFFLGMRITSSARSMCSMPWRTTNTSIFI